ncbi:ABC transporter substrate-binding protein [Telmatocola sphagniphila]|jgi:1,4-dihydroxy-6-naphthoate synthase|uniref:1,4-dihydroxy-6-naphtoate synthase n=1 Tax=Telmatocola sphagniphila TaxID=1123043 RepID=A0A8E6EWW7_9BACT|nr:MqnA/MqnD/SBP family protein [Telmatocola sphagniphila]QVL34420.1 ABC transporter substrate-binding protein [Telmatocola sphagniphila]
MIKQLINVGHSPDPDDAFMFYGLAKDKFDTGRYSFVHQLQDIETLNRRAMKGELEVSAVSLHAYSYLTDKYALMPCGCSMGDDYGPMVVARKELTKAELLKTKIAIPGTLTTAFLTLKLYFEGQPFEFEAIPFDEIIPAVESGKFDAGLIIHEGQLTFQNQGLKLHVDLGVWWKKVTGLPLPLGGNVIRKDLGKQTMSEVTRLIQKSIQFSLDNRADALAYALNYARDMDVKLADKFVGMYVNDWTIDYRERGRQAVERLLREGHRMGIIPSPTELEFVD